MVINTNLLIIEVVNFLFQLFFGLLTSARVEEELGLREDDVDEV